MLVRGSRRGGPLVGSVLFLIFLGLWFYDERVRTFPAEGGRWAKTAWSQSVQGRLLTPGDKNFGRVTDDIKQSHHILYSLSTPDKKYFNITFGDREGINPSILPHPEFNDTWIITAQLQRSTAKSIWFAELVCSATFQPDGSLACTQSPVTMPIASTPGHNCVDDLAFFAFNLGPHDARVFYGPSVPYAIYGSNSGYTCFGMWISDFRTLMDWGFEKYHEDEFRVPTEMYRPPPFGRVEKNWFLFWDANGQMYAHYDIAPKRVFAELSFDGKSGTDLAPAAAAHDDKCLAEYLPRLPETLESIHQASNSLSITLCKRSDPRCEPKDSNTFILTIFQHKTFYSYHSVYEPYAMLFQPRAPFHLYGISTKPLWIYGRGVAGEGRKPRGDDEEPKFDPDWHQTQMVYVTSISWKRHGQKYHGYIDDVIFLGFGIEDTWTGGVDVIAGDLLSDIGLCPST